MIELIGCIMIILITIAFIIMIIDELRTNYELRKKRIRRNKQI